MSGDFGRLKAFVVSGAPILPQTALAARDLLGPRLYQMYGQTEPLARTPLGEISRKALREPFWADAGQRVGGT